MPVATFPTFLGDNFLSLIINIIDRCLQSLALQEIEGPEHTSTSKTILIYCQITVFLGQGEFCWS